MLDPKNITLLVADDEEEIREILAFVFERKGFKVLSAANGREAFDILSKNKIDLVVSDIRMPGGDGVEFLKKAKNLNPELPVVIFITGFADLSLEEAYDLGAEAVFMKPFEHDRLVNAVMQHLQSKDERWGPIVTPVEADLEIDLSLPGFDHARKARVMNLGRGGIFVSLEGEFPKVEDPVSFKIEFSDEETPAIEGGGVVKWVRRENSANGPAGCGIEFANLSDKVRSQVIQLINRLQTKTYIPKS